jgi:hypothetical protein
MGITLLDLILFCLLWSSAWGGVHGEHEMVKSRGGLGADIGSVRRSVANGARQAATRRPPGAGDSLLAQLGWRWADWLPLGRANWAACAGNGNGPHWQFGPIRLTFENRPFLLSNLTPNSNFF